MANCTQTVVARHNYFDLFTAAGVLESFDVLNHKENQKHEKKSNVWEFFWKSKNPKKTIFQKMF